MFNYGSWYSTNASNYNDTIPISLTALDFWLGNPALLAVCCVTIYVTISQVESVKLGHKTMYLQCSLVVCCGSEFMFKKLSHNTWNVIWSQVLFPVVSPRSWWVKPLLCQQPPKCRVCPSSSAHCRICSEGTLVVLVVAAFQYILPSSQFAAYWVANALNGTPFDKTLLYGATCF